jgi:hypothetical protein
MMQEGSYMRRRESRGFFVINVSFFLSFFPSFLPSFRFKRLTRAQVCIDGMDGPLLGRDERSSPEARRVAPLAARGLEGESAAKQ